MSRERNIVVTINAVGVSRAAASLRDFHTKRLRNRGHKLLNNAMLSACVAGLVTAAWWFELVVMWLGVLAALICWMLVFYYFGRFIENTAHLYRLYTRKEW